MKKFSKNTAIILSVILSVVMIVGIVFSFIPMNFGVKRWESFSNSISVSSDLSGGLYGEFKIKTENAKEKDIISSMEKINDVFEDAGYKNINVYSVGTDKIRVEAGNSRTNKTYAETYNKIASLGAGAFSLRTTYSIEEKTISVMGRDCVKDVKIFTNNNINYMSIKFNKEGQKQYENLCKNATSESIYIALGDYAQQISIAGVATYEEFTLSDSDYQNLMELKDNIVLGCMKIELDASSAKIGTMSASLTAGESSSNIYDSSYKTSTIFILLNVAVLVMVVLMIAYFAVRFGFYSILAFVTMLINSCLFVIALNLIPSVEFGLPSYIALIVGVAIIYTYTNLYATTVKSEYVSGKSLNASLESAYKKTMPSVLISNLTLFVSAFVFIACSFGAITSAAIIFAICAFLSLFTNLLIVPFLVKICISFGNFGFKLFMLKKRKGFGDISTDSASLKEAE